MRTPWYLLLLVLPLSGCPTSDGTIPAEDSGDTAPDDTDPDLYDDCPDYDTPVLGACLAWDGAAPDGYEEDGFTVTVAGTVEAVGAGAPEVDCANADDLVGHAPLGYVERLADPSSSWVRVVDAAGQRWTLAWHLPGVAAPAVGAAVTIDADWRRGFADLRGELRLSAADGALIGWLASEASMAALTPPSGMTVAYGDPVCIETDECYEKTHERLAVSEGGVEVTLARGDTQALGSLRVTMGEANSYAVSSSCEDGPANVVELAAAPL